MEAAPAPSEKTSPPFGRYVIRERMAEGGMGEVFLAVAVGADGFEKPVVVKRLLPKFAGRSDIVHLLAAEARLMTRLVHPNIVQVIDFGRADNDDYFLVMELVAGTSLAGFCQAHVLQGSRVPIPLALYITSQVLRGLAYAHSNASADGKRLVHRDISPGNVLLSTFGEVKIADFGVALVASSAEAPGHDGWLVGKPSYMAPEQLVHGSVDERADIYGVGAVLFQVLTGSLHRGAPPFGREIQTFELSSEARAALTDAAPTQLVEVVTRALAPRPEERYESAREMARAIDHLVEMGQKIANADELAEAVTEVVRAQPKQTKSVVLLSDAGGGLTSGTELTRIGNGSTKHGFTLKLPHPVNDAAPPTKPSVEPAPSGGSRRWVAVGAFGLVLVTGTVGIGSWARSRPTVRPDTSSSPLADRARPNGVAAAVSAPLLPDPPPGDWPAVAKAGPAPPATLAENGLRHGAPSRAASATGAAGRRGEAVATAPRPASREAPRESAVTKESAGAAAQNASPECHGQLHLYAGHGWVLSGGPGPVQAPGRYDWPCGTYALKAVSRLDASERRSISVTIREGTPGVVDLR